MCTTRSRSVPDITCTSALVGRERNTLRVLNGRDDVTRLSGTFLVVR